MVEDVADGQTPGADGSTRHQTIPASSIQMSCSRVHRRRVGSSGSIILRRSVFQNVDFLERDETTVEHLVEDLLETFDAFDTVNDFDH